MIFRPLPILTVATALALLVLIGLGIWQLQRRAEKHALLDQIAARGEAAPAPIELLLATGQYAAHRRATALGTFDYAHEAFVYAPRSDPARPGFKVIAPFRLASGATILVDRGWVSDDKKDSNRRYDGQVAGEQEIAGTLRPSSKPGTFTPPPDAANRTFYQRDTVAIAKALGLTLTNTLVLEATTATPGGPEPLTTELNIPDNHLQYALTWFALAVVLLIVYLRFHQMRGLLRFSR